MKPRIDSLVLSRRQFLLGSGGMAIGVAFGVPSLTAANKAQAQGAGLAPNQWVTIATDGTITILSPASEMGQGTLTAMPLWPPLGRGVRQRMFSLRVTLQRTGASGPRTCQLAPGPAACGHSRAPP